MPNNTQREQENIIKFAGGLTGSAAYTVASQAWTQPLTNILTVMGANNCGYAEAFKMLTMNKSTAEAARTLYKNVGIATVRRLASSSIPVPVAMSLQTAYGLSDMQTAVAMATIKTLTQVALQEIHNKNDILKLASGLNPVPNITVGSVAKLGTNMVSGVATFATKPLAREIIKESGVEETQQLLTVVDTALKYVISGVVGTPMENIASMAASGKTVGEILSQLNRNPTMAFRGLIAKTVLSGTTAAVQPLMTAFFRDASSSAMQGVIAKSEANTSMVTSQSDKTSAPNRADTLKKYMKVSKSANDLFR